MIKVDFFDKVHDCCWIIVFIDHCVHVVLLYRHRLWYRSTYCFVVAGGLGVWNRQITDVHVDYKVMGKSHRVTSPSILDCSTFGKQIMPRTHRSAVLWRVYLILASLVTDDWLIYLSGDGPLIQTQWTMQSCVMLYTNNVQLNAWTVCHSNFVTDWLQSYSFLLLSCSNFSCTWFSRIILTRVLTVMGTMFPRLVCACSCMLHKWSGMPAWTLEIFTSFQCQQQLADRSRHSSGETIRASL